MYTENEAYELKCVLEKLEQKVEPSEVQELCSCANQLNNNKKQGE
jgi:hypothetical protein